MQRTALPRSCYEHHREEVGCFLTPNMARGNTQRLAASFSVDGEQFVHPRHNRSCHRVSGIQLHRFEKLSSCMRPASGMHHSRPADLVISRVSIGLENALEMSQEPLRSAEVEPAEMRQILG